MTSKGHNQNDPIYKHVQMVSKKCWCCAEILKLWITPTRCYVTINHLFYKRDNLFDVSKLNRQKIDVKVLQMSNCFWCFRSYLGPTWHSKNGYLLSTVHHASKPSMSLHYLVRIRCHKQIFDTLWWSDRTFQDTGLF